MADGTSVVSDRWGTSSGPRALRERPQYASRLRLPAAAENRRNCSQVSPRAGRLPSGRGPNADRPFDEPTTSTARRVAAATWMMSSTTVASRAYAVVPARRSRGSRAGASRPSSAPAAGSARHQADASRRDRAARSPDPQPASCRRSFRRGSRARAAPSTRHRWCPRPDQQPLSGCVGRDVLAGACAPTPGPAGAVPVRVRSRSSAGLRWTRGRTVSRSSTSSTRRDASGWPSALRNTSQPSAASAVAASTTSIVSCPPCRFTAKSAIGTAPDFGC